MTTFKDRNALTGLRIRTRESKDNTAMQETAARPPLRVNNRRDLLLLDRDLRNLNDAFILFAAIPCKEIKFGVVSSNSRMIKSKNEPQFLDREVEIVEDSVPITVDLLHGFTFPVSVLCFRLWIEQTGDGWKDLKPSEIDKMPSNPSAVQINIVDLRKSSKAVKEVRFETPVAITPNFRYRMSYIPNPREFYGNQIALDYDDSTYKYLVATHFTVSMLVDDARNNLRDGMVSRSYRPLPDSAFFIGGPTTVDKTTGEVSVSIEDREPQYKCDEKWLPISVKPTVILRDGSVYDKNVVDIDLQTFTIPK